MERGTGRAASEESAVAGDGVQPTRASVREALERELDEFGEELQEDPEDAGAVGFTMFDSAASTDGTVAVLLPKDDIAAAPGQSLVRIKSKGDGRSYLGAVVKGPFAEPDGLRADAPVIVTATVRGKGKFFLPQFHGRAQVELMGEELQGGGMAPPRRRPLPNSPVFLLSKEETATVLRTAGDLRLGLVDGQDDIEVKAPAKGQDAKAVLPRHLGILGTTGGGKSTTVSGIIAQLQQAGASCILLDTEGEYTAINEPTQDETMLRALDRRGLEPADVKNTAIYHLVGRETANPGHPRNRGFSLQFSEISPYAVMEILELNEAQQERYLKAFDITKTVLDRLKIVPKPDVEADELETGYPRMTLAHLYDMVKIIASQVAKEEHSPFVDTKAFLQGREVKDAITNASIPGNVQSWRALQGRLGRISRLRVFDNPEADPPNYKAMLEPGKVTIIDLSDTDSPQVNNLVIAQILRGVQRQQDENYQKAIATDQQPNLTMVFIEEAHEFLSTERIKDMPVLFQQVARIARRGRKRWLGLAFITQLPQHLPDEVLGLVNNWVLHKINDANVVSRLRRSIGGIDAALWDRLSALAPGQAIVSFTHLARPLQVAVDPTPCKLLMAE